MALVVLLSAGLRLERRRRTWRRERVDGVEVLVSPETGPAVVGLSRSVIVLPHWALEAEASLRDFMILHEQEHRRAGDHRLLFAGLGALVLMPWNPAVWWQVRRLRLALELDCDARVLRARPDVCGYGEVLLRVARHPADSALMPAFLERHSQLERRIRSMTTNQPNRRALRASALVAAAVLGVAVACEVPAPALTDPGTRAASKAAAPPHAGVRRFSAPDGEVAELINPREVDGLRETWYPPLLRQAGIGGTVHVWLSIDADGRVVDRRIDRSSGEGPLDVAAVRVAGVMRFRPRPDAGAPAVLRVSVPITFGRPPTPEEAKARMREKMLRAFVETETR